MMKTLCFSFVPLPDVDREKWPSVFHKAREHLLSRRLHCDPAQTDTGILKAFWYHKDWPGLASELGIVESHENTYWNIGLSGLRFSHVSAEYDNAFLLYRKYDHHRGAQPEFHDGESHYYPEDDLHILVTCLPTPSTVKIEMDLSACTDIESYNRHRKGFVTTQGDIEKAILRNRAARNLIDSITEDPGNKGRIERYKKDLLIALCAI